MPDFRQTALPDPAFQPGFYAAVPTKRLVAWLVDAGLVLLMTLLILPLTGFLALFFLPAFFAVIDFCYRWFTISRRSATLGMRLVAIELRDADGRRLDPLVAALHTIGYMVSIAMVLPQVVSVVLMLTGARAQGLNDLVLGTAAINRPADRA